MANVFDSIGDIVSAIGEKTSSSIEITKLSFYVNEQEKILAQAKKEMGDFYFTRLLTEEEPAEEILEAFEKAKDAQERIVSAKMKIEELEKQVNEPITPGKKACQVCGEVIHSSANYCPECGAAFAEEVEVDETEAEAAECETVDAVDETESPAEEATVVEEEAAEAE